MSEGGVLQRRRASALLGATLALGVGVACSSAPPQAAAGPDLGAAVGAAAVCRTLSPAEAARPASAPLAAREQLLRSILSTWHTASAGGGSWDTFSLRVDVVRSGAAAVAEASVEVSGVTVKVPVQAKRSGGPDTEISLAVAAQDDPQRTTAFATIGANGRVSFTHCGELWSLPPTAGSERPAASAGGARGGEAGPAGLLVTAAGERYFGGRTPGWWAARLTELKRTGPPRLYALALQRARAAGLTVRERGDGIDVEPPPRGEFR